VASGAVATARAGVATANQAEAAAQLAINTADQALAAADLAIAQARDAVANRGQVRDVANRQKSAAEAQRDQASAQMAAAQAQKTQANASLSSARAQLEQAQRALDDADLIAPIAGTIISIASQVGEALGSGAGAGLSTGTTGGSGGGGAFIHLADLGGFEVRADFAEADVVGIVAGQEVSLTFDAIPGAGQVGTVRDVALVGGVDPAGGRLTTFEVIISLPAPPEGLRVGMTAQASITTEERADV
jgi:multidrug efflux pump subunit AcrA (membrane-fusion protein)